MINVPHQQILVVDDEEAIRELVGSYLRNEGFDVREAVDGDDALAQIARSVPDLIVLDLRLPGISGLDVLREIRRTSEVYVIVLTARADETDKLIGLELGADDYITKPFSPREVVARVRAVLRRGRADARGSGNQGQSDAEVIRLDGLTIDVGRHEVRVDDEPVELTTLEFQLLATLAEAPGRVFTRGQLIERVWGWDFYGDERLVDVHIGNLRRALGDAADAPGSSAPYVGWGTNASRARRERRVGSSTPADPPLPVVRRRRRCWRDRDAGRRCGGHQDGLRTTTGWVRTRARVRPGPVAADPPKLSSPPCSTTPCCLRSSSACLPPWSSRRSWR